MGRLGTWLDYPVAVLNRHRGLMSAIAPLVYIGDLWAFSIVFWRIEDIVIRVTAYVHTLMFSQYGTIQDGYCGPDLQCSLYTYEYLAVTAGWMLAFAMLYAVCFVLHALMVSVVERLCKPRRDSFSHCRAAMGLQSYLRSCFLAFLAWFSERILGRGLELYSTFVIEATDAPREMLSIRLREILVVRRIGSATAA